MTHTDLDAIRRELAMMGQLVYLGVTSTSCVVSLQHKDGRVFTAHLPTEAECLENIQRQTRESML
jgi:hypothetical protein